MGHFAQSGTVTLALLGDIWVNVAFLTASNEWFNKYLMARLLPCRFQQMIENIGLKEFLWNNYTQCKQV